MLYRELPDFVSMPGGRIGRWTAPLIAFAAGLTAAAVLLLAGLGVLAALPAVAGLVLGAILARKQPTLVAADPGLAAGPDFALVGAILAMTREPMALTSGEGSLLVANPAYRERFGHGAAPMALGDDPSAREGLELVQAMAWRDGAGCVSGIVTAAGTTPVEVQRVGARSDLLLWRFPEPGHPDASAAGQDRIDQGMIESLDSAGILAARIDSDGRLLAANRSFLDRVVDQAEWDRRPVGQFLSEDAEGTVRLVSEGKQGRPLRARPPSRRLGLGAARNAAARRSRRGFAAGAGSESPGPARRASGRAGDRRIAMGAS